MILYKTAHRIVFKIREDVFKRKEVKAVKVLNKMLKEAERLPLKTTEDFPNPFVLQLILLLFMAYPGMRYCMRAISLALM